MKNKLALALALAAAPFAASAGDFSYTYVEGGASHLSVDTAFNEEIGDFAVAGEDSVALGGFLRGSFELGANAYVFGGYERAREDNAGLVVVDLNTDEVLETTLEETYTETHIGLGFHTAIGEKSDFFAEVGAVEQKLEVVSNDFAEIESDGSIRGGRVSIGVRGQVAAPLEVTLKGTYSGGGDFHNKIGGKLGALYRINDTWGVTADIEGGNLGDGTQFVVGRLGVRASF